MIGKARMALGLLMVAAGTVPLALYQMIALRTGLPEHWAPRAWHRLIVAVLGFRVRVHGELSAARPLLIAANHISWTDIMVLGSIADVYFVAKSELRGWPIMGTLSTLQRTIFVERERRRRSGDQAREIAGRIATGHPIVLFAEGSTADGNLLLPFKSTLFGAAQMAITDGGSEIVHVQPVAIAYTRLQGIPMGRFHRSHAAWIGDRELWPHVTALLTEGGLDVEVRFGEPLRFSRGDDRKAVARAAQESVRAMMVAALHRPGG